MTALTLNGPRQPETMTLPSGEQVSLRLPEPLAALRQTALAKHAGLPFDLVERSLIDAAAWAQHTADEPWLVWRARRVAARLREMPLELEPGELLVGKPLLRVATPDEQPALASAAEQLRDMPPFPGGDAGHFHPDYPTLLEVGIDGLRQRIAVGRAAATSPEQEEFYTACEVVTEALSAFCCRVAAACEQMATNDPGDAPRWLALADLCRQVSGPPPTTFHAALQLVFLTQVACWYGEDHYLTCFGRPDRDLRHFYEADLAAGRITAQQALNLLSAIYIQSNRICRPSLAVAVMVGGQDEQDQDATCDLTYLCLAARLATWLAYPTVSIAWHEGTPDELMDLASEMLATGIGCPAFFNDDLIAAGLRRHGVTDADARRYINSTCVEIKVAGASNVWVTQPYYNLPSALLDELRWAAAGEATEPADFAELSGRIRDNLRAQLASHAGRLDAIWRQREVTGGFPLASCLTADCLARGQDFDRGGARYNWVENSIVGLANLADSLVAVKHLVYDHQELTCAELHAVLADNWAGHERLRQRVLNRLPRYGNADPQADALAAEWAEFMIEATEALQVGPHCYVPGFFCWVMHERLGSQTGATPDGRLAGLPLADGAGAAQGRETAGPTASLLSTTCWSHEAAIGGLVHNLKLSDSLLRTAADRAALRHLIETYLRRGGFELQVNVVGRETLLAAKANPDQYTDLIVRVAGYSDYFVGLSPAMQDEVIARTEHTW